MVSSVTVLVQDNVVCFNSADAFLAAAVAVVTVPVLLTVAVVVALRTASVACFFQVCSRGNNIDVAA